jgi:hypothetical protein
VINKEDAMGNHLRGGQAYWWRFIGDKEYKYAWVTIVDYDQGLYKMGFYNGATTGPVVDIREIEYREYKG